MTYWNSMCAYACIHADTRYKINFRDCSPWNRVQMIEEWSSLICAGIVLYQIWHSGSRNYDNFLFYCFYAKNFIFPCSSKWKWIFRSLRDIEDVPLRRKLIFLQKPWTPHRPFYLYFCFIRATIRSCLCFILALLIGLYHKYAYWGNGARRWLMKCTTK